MKTLSALKRFLPRGICLFLLIVLLGFNFNGCFSQEDDPYSAKERPEYFHFDTYNVLELEISETNRFVLYYAKRYDKIREESGLYSVGGIGKWINGSSSTLVTFYQGSENTKKRYITIDYASNTPYFSDIGVPREKYEQTSGLIAKLDNNTENPLLYWCESCNPHPPYKEKFGLPIPVSIKTYTEEDIDADNYIPPEARAFYDKTEDAIYSCEEAGFWFDAKTMKGTWKIRDNEYSVIAAFDEKWFHFSLHYATEDEHHGILIFKAYGIGNSVSETQMAYEIETMPDYCYDESFKEFTITKTIQ